MRAARWPSPINLDGLVLDAESQRAAVAALAQRLHALGAGLAEVGEVLADLLRRVSALEARGAY